MSLTPDGSNLWICYPGDNVDVHVISTENPSIIDVPISNCTQIAFSSDSSTAYITTYSPSTIAVFDTGTLTQTGTITLPNGDRPIAIAITTVGGANFAYVTAQSGGIGAIYAIDLSNNNAITTVARGSSIWAFNTIEASADGNCVCAANLATLTSELQNTEIFVIDTSDNSFQILSPGQENVTGMLIFPNTGS
jgi:DNA-binding beta-propeller fold protein YncE